MSCFVTPLSALQNAGFVWLPEHGRANHTFPFLESNAINISRTRTVQLGVLGDMGEMIHYPALLFSIVQVNPIQEAFIRKEMTHDFSTPMWRFVKGGHEDRLAVLLASLLFMNFVLVVSILLIFSVISVNERHG